MSSYTPPLRDACACVRACALADPELKQLQDAAHADLEKASSTRFPAPEIFECEQYASKARYLVQKLNPDVPLTAFLQGLYKAVVA